MLRRWRKRGPVCRRAIALLVLCGFVVTFIGVPVPVATPGKDPSSATANSNHRCCCQKAGNGASQCCGNCGCGKRKAAAAVATDAVSQQAEPQFELVLSIATRKCQGHAEVWLALGAIALPPERVVISVDGTCRENLVTASTTLSSLDILPATPPPRV